jgi:anti-anti-sigma factor
MPCVSFVVDGISAGARTVHLSGELDAAGAAEAAAAIAWAVSDAQSVVVDLSTLTFLDSSGFRAIERGRLFAESVGHSFSVVGAHGIVHRVFDILTSPDAPGRGAVAVGAWKPL